MKRTTGVMASLALLAVALATPAAASVQGSFERTFQVTGAVDLEIFTRSGDIVVRSGSAGTVKVSGKIHVADRWLGASRQADVSEIENNPPLRQTGNSIGIDYVNAHDISIDYEITVPEDTSVRSHSGSGDQSIVGLRKGLDLESGSGDMRLQDLTGGVRLHTGSGDVEARDVSGSFDAETGSGDIRLDAKANGEVRVHTGSGDVELRGVNGTVQAEAGSGDISVAGTQTGTWEIRTSSGSVDVQLQADAGFDLDAFTGSGEAVVGRPVTMIIQGRVEESRRRVKGKVGNGGAQLIVHTGSGDVHIN